MYDVQGAIDLLFEGLVIQANLLAAATERWLEKGEPLEASDVAGILARANVLLAAEPRTAYVPSTQPPYPASLPPYPSGLPRFADSNPTPNGWSITSDEKVVHGGPR
jgi:hypothetical protein